MVAAGRRVGTPRRRVRGPVPGRGGQRHRPVGLDRAGRRGGSSGRPVRAVERHPRGAVLAGGGGRTGLRLRAQAVGHLAAAQRRHPDDVRRRPGRPHPLPAARAARPPGTCPLAAGAGRLPDHAVDRGARCQPRLDDRGVADRQPLAGDAGLRRRARAGLRGGPVPAPASRGHRVGRRPGPPRGGRRARHPGRGRRRHRPAGPALGRRRRGRDRAGRAARLDRHDRLDQRPGAPQEERPAPDAGHRAGPRQRVVPARQQPGVRRPQPPVVAGRGCARHVVRRAAGRGRGHPTGRRRRAVHTLVDGRTLTGRRPQRPSRLPRRGRDRDPRAPHPGRARGRRAERELVAGRGGAVRRRTVRRAAPGRRGSTLRPVVPGARRRHRPPDRPGHRPVAGRAARRGAVRGPLVRPDPPRRGARAGAHGRPVRPDPRHRATYDALARELPRLYAAQKGFFRRRSTRT